MNECFVAEELTKWTKTGLTAACIPKHLSDEFLIQNGLKQSS
jgi:hypothetical protein